MLVDTHCHLPSPHEQKELASILKKSQDAGVKKIINIGTSIEESLKAIEVADHYQHVYASVGIYPNKERNVDLETLENKLKKLVLSSKKVVAIGECGMDITRCQNQRPIEEQKKLFQLHIKLACKYHLPLIIHNRKASTEILESLQLFKDQATGVFHCFVGSKHSLKQVLGLGFYIGVAGLITYDQGLQEVIKTVPLNRILVETDSPYLMPEPIRSKRRWPNEPKNVKIIVEKIAKIRGDSFVFIAGQTTKNAKKLFCLQG